VKNGFTGNPATNDHSNCHAAATDITVYVLLTDYWHSLPLSFFFCHLVCMFVNFLRITLMFVSLLFLCWTLAFFTTHELWILQEVCTSNYLLLLGSLNYAALHFGVFSVPSATSVQILHSFLFA
jgi:hypothetical protein